MGIRSICQLTKSLEGLVYLDKVSVEISVRVHFLFFSTSLWEPC